MSSVTEVVKEIVNSWGQKDSYSVTAEEIAIIEKAEGSSSSEVSNGDGTKTKTVSLQGKKFILTEVLPPEV